MHDVLVEPAARHRPEGPDADVQRQPHDLDAARGDGGEDLRREMQRCRRRRHAARNAREHRLVALRPRVVAAADVRRQRNLSAACEQRFEVDVGSEAQDPRTVGEHLDDLGRRAVERDVRAAAQPLARAHERKPLARRVIKIVAVARAQ